MNAEIANIVLDAIKDLNWVDKYAGLVRPVTIVQPTPTGTIRKVFPVSCSINETQCKPGDYQELIPNTNYKSVVYFEDGGVTVTGRDARFVDCRSTLSLIAWLNGKKLGNDGCDLSSIAVLNIIKALTPYFSNFNSGSFAKIKIAAVSEDPKNANIFTRYSYDESTTQYLMYPFDYFRLNLSVVFSVPLGCIDDMTIEERPC